MTVVAITFGLVALAEVADTSALVTLVLATRLPPRWVFLGVGAGMAVHVALALAAGSLVALLPQRPLEAVLTAIFLLGAYLIWREGEEDDDDVDPRPVPATRWGVVATAFSVTVLSELADPSQVVVAALAARYGDPVSVGVGALLGLWAVSALAVWGGDRVRRLVPVRWVTRVAAAIMVAFALVTAVDVLVG